MRLSAPYLATRVFFSIIRDEYENYPLELPVLAGDFYVDDVLRGTAPLIEVKELQSELVEALKCSGMSLHK